jgi:bifunctional UDP-N-acetylglucosamine pyrophosphorylase/glucosamine-1-phosphate N-acetyltransferase
LFEANFLNKEILKLKSNNQQAELYLTDLLGNPSNGDWKSAAVRVKNPWDLMGVNNTYELSLARSVAQMRLQKRLAQDLGVYFRDPASTFVSARAEFQGSADIGAGVQILGKSRVGVGVVLDGMTRIENSQLASGSHILWGCVLSEAEVGPNSSVGPMAHLRPGSVLDSDVKVGNFVELKKTRMKSGSKVSHLSYLGDAEVGRSANIGCGTITCNYDGISKHPTHIGEGAFIGSDTQLIAPVTIGAGAYVASGTTVTKDVPKDALALSRPEMVIKPGYAAKLLARRKEKK